VLAVEVAAHPIESATQPVPELRDVECFLQRLSGPAWDLAECGAGRNRVTLGGNASGKSRTMKTVLGLLKPKAGHVMLDSRVADKPRQPIEFAAA